MSNVNIKQLYDDLGKFFPITCVDAVVGGSVSTRSTPKVIDLGSYISEDFSGIFKLYIYDDILKIFEVEVSTENFDVSADSNNIIANGIPVSYYPQEPLVFKTVTDDNTCKANVLLDTDGILSLQLVPRREIQQVIPKAIAVTTDTSSSGVEVVNITSIKATAIEIIASSK